MHTPLTALCWSSLKYSGVFDDFLMCHLRGTHKTFSKSPQVLIWTVLFLKGSLFNVFRNAMVLREQQWPFEGMEDWAFTTEVTLCWGRGSQTDSPHLMPGVSYFFSSAETIIERWNKTIAYPSYNWVHHYHLQP